MDANIRKFIRFLKDKNLFEHTYDSLYQNIINLKYSPPTYYCYKIFSALDEKFYEINLEWLNILVGTTKKDLNVSTNSFINAAMEYETKKQLLGDVYGTYVGSYYYDLSPRIVRDDDYYQFTTRTDTTYDCDTF